MALMDWLMQQSKHDTMDRAQKEALLDMFHKSSIMPNPPSPGGVLYNPAITAQAGVASGVSASGSQAEQFNSFKLCEMLAMRMRWPKGTALPMSFLEAHKCKDTVFVFMVHNGQAVVLEDDWHMFPSDTLITKIRLIVG